VAFTPPLFLADLDQLATDPVVLTGPEGHHAATVQRIEVGEVVDLSDGAGLRLRCEVIEVGRDRLVGRVLRRSIEAPASPRLTVVQALAKGDRGELAVELMTEIGVDEILPWQAHHCVTRWKGERGAKALTKWRSTARAAAKQARRARLPEIGEPVTTLEIAARLRGADAAVILDGSASDRLARAPLPADGEVVLVVGPEGGVADDEMATFTEAGARRAALGATVLRTSTAGAAAVAVLRSRAEA
jgi:16S rRNA (uracil1498-N3)-methyltransferase